MTKRPIYLDHHATTPLDPRVREAMMPYLTEAFGNASSSSHAYGWEAEAAVEQARERVAALLNAAPEEIVFTSGATESDNLALFGAARAAARGRRVVTGATEHHAVLDAARALGREGFDVEILQPDREGCYSLEKVAGAVTEKTVLVSLMLANNEIGTLQPIAEIAQLCRERGAVFHTDAVQALGSVAFDVKTCPVDLASVSAHKMYGPKGVGALYVRSGRPRVRLTPLFYGGGQESGIRPGTLNVAGIVGFGKACELAASSIEEDACRLRRLRRRLSDGLGRALDGLVLNGPPLPAIGDGGELLEPERRLPGNLNVSIERVDGNALLADLKDIAVSSGAACTSAAVEPSHVLRAIGVPHDLAFASIRFGVGRFNTDAEIDAAVACVAEAAGRLRELHPA
jgi:cysteine desulfurase